MHVLIDVFDCDLDLLDAFEPRDEWDWHLSLDTRQVWIDLFSVEDFDADALAREVLAALGGSAAEYQVIERSTKIRKPRGVVPWFTVTPPVPEPEPEEPALAPGFAPEPEPDE